MHIASNALPKSLPILVTALALACSGGGSATSPDLTSGSQPSPNVAGEPTDDDWVQLGAQFAAIGVDSLEDALSSSGTTAVAASQVWGSRDLNVPLNNLSWNSSYFCCGSFGPGTYVTTGGAITVSRDNAGVVTVTETIHSVTQLTWSVPSSTYTIELPTDGLTITSRLVTADGKILPKQEFRLVGRLTYIGPNGPKTATIDVSLGYGNFQTEPPTATGQIGPFRASGRPLPGLQTFARCPCPGGPFPGASPVPGCSIMCR